MKTASPVTSRVLERALTLSILATVFFLLAVPARPQNPNGSMNGTITDASEAVVAGAEVTLTQAARNITLRASSEAYGTYSFPNLEPGLYDLTVSAPRFLTATQKAIPIDVGRQVRVDVRLEIGSLRCRR